MGVREKGTRDNDIHRRKALLWVQMTSTVTVTLNDAFHVQAGHHPSQSRDISFLVTFANTSLCVTGNEKQKVTVFPGTHIKTRLGCTDQVLTRRLSAYPSASGQALDWSARTLRPGSRCSLLNCPVLRAPDLGGPFGVLAALQGLALDPTRQLLCRLHI